MSLIGLIILFIVVGVGLWLINAYVPMQPQIKNLLNVVAIIALVVIALVWLLSFAGVNVWRY